MDIVGLILVGLLGLAAGAAGTWLTLRTWLQAEVTESRVTAAKAEAERDAARQEAAAIRADRESLVTQFRALSDEAIERQTQRVDAAAQQRQEATDQLMKPVKETLTALQQRLSEAETNRQVLTAELRGHIDRVQKVGEDVRLEAKTLVNALRKPQQRGAWGELQLRRVVEIAGMLEHCDFSTQDSTTTPDGRLRPDLKVYLGEDKFVFVDSKVPLDAFLSLGEAADEAAETEARASFARHVRKHIDQLSDKHYWSLDAGTPDFVMLFIPSDALFFEALNQLPDLYEYASKRQIVLSSPTSLIATLRAIAYGWKQAALADSARDISELGKELYERLSIMGGKFDQLGRSLRSTVKHYNETVGSLESRVFTTARKFRDLKVTEARLEEPKAVDDPVRDLAAAELIADAALLEPLPTGVASGAIRTADLHVLTREMPSTTELVDAAHTATAEPETSRRRTAG